MKLLAAAIIIWLARRPIFWLGAQAALELGRGLHWVVGRRFLFAFPGFKYLYFNWPQVAGYFAEHLRLTGLTIVISLAIALPFGIFLNRARWLYVPTFSVLNLIYTIPSLALFAVLIPFTAETETTALIALVAYAQFILVRNVAVGLDSVPREVIEAARGMGMNPIQILFRVEIPLALPVIVSGLRIATVATIGITAVAALITIQTLGFLFFDAVQNNGIHAHAEIEAGAIAVTAMALGADGIFRLVELMLPASRVARAGRDSRVRRLLDRVRGVGAVSETPELTGPRTA